MSFEDQVEAYIKKQERFYNRSLRPLNKYLLRDFAKSLSPAVNNINKSPVVIDEKLPDQKIRVAFISEEIGHLTGGRYYAWFIACALVELGFDVTFYTNQEPIYAEAFSHYSRPRIQLVDKRDLETLDVPADIYISSPLYGNFAVVNLREKYKKPSYVMIFDPSPTMKKYLGTGYVGWERLAPRIRKSDVNIISLCHAMSKDIPERLDKRDDQIFPVYPCINSVELDRAKMPEERGDYVVFISRLVKHKGVEDVISAVVENNIKLKIISSNDGLGIQKILKKYKAEKLVELCFRVPDKEKFEIIGGAKAVINASYFEGFGMWSIEAFATGTPLVAYEFPTLREVEEYSGADNFYFAKMADKADLSKKLELALKEAKFRARNKLFDFGSMVSRLGEIICPEPKIGVVTIALNEEKFIGASLKSVIKHENISRVVVIEGAVNLFAHAASPEGLSVDKTSNEVFNVMQKDDNGKKIVFERHGWAVDKSELRNRALAYMPKDITHILVVDALS